MVHCTNWRSERSSRSESRRARSKERRHSSHRSASRRRCAVQSVTNDRRQSRLVHGNSAMHSGHHCIPRESRSVCRGIIQSIPRCPTERMENAAVMGARDSARTASIGAAVPLARQRKCGSLAAVSRLSYRMEGIGGNLLPQEIFQAEAVVIGDTSHPGRKNSPGRGFGRPGQRERRSRFRVSRSMTSAPFCFLATMKASRRDFHQHMTSIRRQILETCVCPRPHHP